MLNSECVVEEVFIWDRGWAKEPRVKLKFDGCMPMHYSCRELGHPKEFWEKFIGKRIKISTIVEVSVV